MDVLSAMGPLFAQDGGGWAQFLQMAPFLAIAVVFYFLILRPGSQEQRRRDEMLKSLKKNDKIYTSAGIIGVIANLSPDGREATLKVDDNTKIRVLRRTIEGLYNEPTGDSSSTSS